MTSKDCNTNLLIDKQSSKDNIKVLAIESIRHYLNLFWNLPELPKYSSYEEIIKLDFITQKQFHEAMSVCSAIWSCSKISNLGESKTVNGKRVERIHYYCRLGRRNPWNKSKDLSREKQQVQIESTVEKNQQDTIESDDKEYNEKTTTTMRSRRYKRTSIECGCQLYVYIDKGADEVRFFSPDDDHTNHDLGQSLASFCTPVVRQLIKHESNNSSITNSDVVKNIKEKYPDILKELNFKIKIYHIRNFRLKNQKLSNVNKVQN